MRQKELSLESVFSRDVQRLSKQTWPTASRKLNKQTNQMVEFKLMVSSLLAFLKKVKDSNMFVHKYHFRLFHGSPRCLKTVNLSFKKADKKGESFWFHFKTNSTYKQKFVCRAMKQGWKPQVRECMRILNLGQVGSLQKASSFQGARKFQAQWG